MEGWDIWTQVPLQLCRQKQPGGSTDWALREPLDLGAQILALLGMICSLPLNPWHDPPLASHNPLQTQVVSLVDFIRLLQILTIRIIQSRNKTSYSTLMNSKWLLFLIYYYTIASLSGKRVNLWFAAGFQLVLPGIKQASFKRPSSTCDGRKEYADFCYVASKATKRNHGFVLFSET